jgi:LPXTG-site transpeptidase (sortase) family protein
MFGKRRHPDRSGSPRWTRAVLVVGAVIALAGGYLEFRGGTSAADQGAEQAQQATPAELPSSSRPVGAPTTKPKPVSTPTAAPKTTTSTRRSASGGPVRVSIPRLGVSARVLGIRASGGQLIPPSNPRLVGWWSDGARPGAAKGSAIITGHTVHTGGGAFDNLDRLRAGDLVKVTTAKSTISYAVVAVTTYRKRALAKQAAQIFDQSVPGRLVLVTCEDWNGTTYLSNAVVIAEPIG